MTHASKSVLSLAAAFGLIACSGSDPIPTDSVGGSTSTTVGGSTVSNVGGQATGGSANRGGTPGSGGSTATGGTTTANGGTVATGGMPATGGTTTANGGMVATGGMPATGGRGAGGASTGGVTATGGMPATGGRATGGVTATGGTPATGGVTAQGGGGCAVTPVTPNATQQTKNVLCYLYSIYGNHVLAGQQEANWNDNPTDFSSYAVQGLSPPAVHGTDFAYHSNAGCTGVNISTTHAIAHWNAGGLVMYRYHSGLPVSGTTCMNDCYSGTNCSMSTPPSGFFTNVITPGTAENTSWNGRLDYMTIQFKAMAAANMPVILALFHEIQSNGWFWWAKTTNATDFINLYKYSFDYLTKTKGNTNIIWLMPYSGSPTASFYPGKAYVDIGGGDTYGTNGPFASLYNSCRSIFGTTMPIALHECGTAPLPSQMFPTAAPWVLFSVWAGYENNQWANLKTIYADSRTITRDLMPNLK